jgi:hypothetical protein
MAWRRAILVTILLTAWTLAHSKSTKLVTSWKNPNYFGQTFHRILVLGMSENPIVRLDFEDALADKISRDGVESVPGHAILFRPESPHMDMDYLKGQIRDHNIDAVIVSRLVKLDKKTTHIPGHSYVLPHPYYGTFYGYYGSVYGQVYTPGYLREDTTVRIETNLYSATPPDEELVWMGFSDTFNPKNADKVIAGLVSLVVKELEKEAILNKSSQ